MGQGDKLPCHRKKVSAAKRGLFTLMVNEWSGDLSGPLKGAFMRYQPEHLRGYRGGSSRFF